MRCLEGARAAAVRASATAVHVALLATDTLLLAVLARFGGRSGAAGGGRLALVLRRLGVARRGSGLRVARLLAVRRSRGHGRRRGLGVPHAIVKRGRRGGRSSGAGRSGRGTTLGAGRSRSLRGLGLGNIAAAARTSRTVASRRGGLAGLVDEVGAGVGELDVRALESAASVANVGLEDGRARAEARATAAALDRNVRTVHVHLAVAKVVEPSPGKDGITARGVRGDSNGVVRRRGRRGTVADDRLDDGESLTAVVRERGLARASSVLGTTLKGEVVVTSSVPLGDRGAGRSVEVAKETLAGEVGAVGVERGSHAVLDLSRVGVGL